MAVKKNVTLVTWHTSNNYGTCLQCYALAEFMRSNGFNVVIPNTYKYYYGVKHPIETLKNIIGKIKRKHKNPELNEALKTDFEIRMRKNVEFSKNKTKISDISSYGEYKSVINNTDVFVTGSDQIWNPNNMTPPMLLKMAPNKAKKIAYASSIGVGQLPDNMLNYYRKSLSRFDAIGVRESTAKNIIENLINKSVNVVLDPSFLLNKEQWTAVAEKPEKMQDVQNPFVFCYFIRKNIPTDAIEDYCKSTGKIPVYILSETAVIPQTKGIVLADAGIQEFVWGMLNADCIITDSFHATALSINFNKQFFVYKRFKAKDKASQNSRIEDLLKMFELEERLVSDKDDLIKYSELNNFEKVNAILKEEKNKSVDYLLRSLSLN